MHKSLTPKSRALAGDGNCGPHFSLSPLEKLKESIPRGSRSRTRPFVFREGCLVADGRQRGVVALTVAPASDPSHTKEPGVSSSLGSLWQAAGIPCDLLFQELQLL